MNKEARWMALSFNSVYYTNTILYNLYRVCKGAQIGAKLARKSAQWTKR